MSQENVELVERGIELFNRRDLDGMTQLADEDFEFVSMLSAVDSEATYRGPQAFADYFEAIDQTWEEWSVVQIEIFDAGDDLVAARFRIAGKGRESGVHVERNVGMTYEFRHGRFWRMRAYLDPADALEAVGLSE